ncbi:MAG: right-handed parallel beta-helix repeat-containing protein, partial [Nanoarchaeota archaeon]|nr:right-handed parallel beta-helix repeat-containing protein [Nanoarchaeota archaeon]
SRAILINDRERIVEFYLGGFELQVIDNDFTDHAFDSAESMLIDSTVIDDAHIQIRAAILGNTIEISSIYYQLQADSQEGLSDELYVAKGKGIRDYLDDPRSLMGNNIDFKYEGVSYDETSEATFNSDGTQNKYVFGFTNIFNQEYELPMLEAHNGRIYLGTHEHKLVMMETAISGDYILENGMHANPYFVSVGDFFVVSDREDGQGVTVVLRFDSVDATNNSFVVSDLAAGPISVVVNEYPPTPGDYTSNGGCDGSYYGDIIAGYNMYRAYICGNQTIGYNLSVDHNGDGVITPNQTVNITSFGNVMFKIDIQPSEYATGYFEETEGDILDANVITLQRFFDENGPAHPDTGLPSESDEVEYLKFVGHNSGSEVSLEIPETNYFVVMHDNLTNESLQHGLSPYGTIWELSNPIDQSETLTLTIPREQAEAQAFITAGNIVTINNPNDYGVLNNNSNNTRISNSKFDNLWTGINTIHSASLEILDNEIVDNYVGMNSNTLLNSMIEGNLFSGNENKGIIIHGTANTLFDNTFRFNSQHAFELSDGNNWNTSDTGNYWDDFESNPGYPEYYEIPGPGDGIDHQPIWPIHCGITLAQDTVLEEDLVCYDTGIIIGADDITLDCDGHTIERAGDNMDIGINMDGRTSVVITDCNLLNYYEGISLQEASENEIRKSTFTGGEGKYGIYSINSSNNSIRANEFHDMHGMSAYLVNSHDNLFEKNRLYELSYDGLSLRYSNGNIIRANDIHDTSDHSIALQNSNKNVIEDNHVYDNLHGIVLVIDSHDNTIVGNRVIDNEGVGVYIRYGSDDNTVKSNTLTGNEWGIGLLRSDDQLVYGNLIRDNEFYGVNVYNSSDTLFYKNRLIGNEINAYEVYSGYENRWNLHTTGNYWSDFQSNPGYPYEYQIDGPGNGVDYHPLWFAASLANATRKADSSINARTTKASIRMPSTSNTASQTKADTVTTTIKTSKPPAKNLNTPISIPK